LVLASDVDVGGGRTIHIVCQGQTDYGRPTIVFENGAGPTMATWSDVIPEAAKTGRACAYDRAGVGQSEPGPADRTTRDQAADLVAALEGVEVIGPIVIVAHSRGFWNATVYTEEHPEQVAGVVLVDPAPAGLDARWLEELPPETPDEHPDITEARTIMSDHSGDPSVAREHLDLEASEAQVLAAPGFGARPVEILWATKSGASQWPASFDADLVTRLNGVLAELQRDIEGLADDPNVTLVDSGHGIQEEQPGAVAEAIERLLAKLGGTAAAS
jgi:pimeloyl-ACP methyl ester carboxylesterase